jgi:hypothetical protein
LVDLYFTKINLYLPLLHRPSFERHIAEGLHLTDDGFGGTVLLVCASGSRFSEDRRVLLEGEESFHSAGWKWFEQVHVVKKSLLSPPSLYDLQYYCVWFLSSFSSAPLTMTLAAFSHVSPRLVGTPVMLDHGWDWHSLGPGRGCSPQESQQNRAFRR